MRRTRDVWERRLWPVLIFRALIPNSWQYLQLHAAVPAVTRRVPWPASNAGTATCGYRFWQVSFHTLPALHLRQLRATLTSPTRNRDRIGTNGRCDSGSTSSPKNTAAFSSGRRLRRPRQWPSPCEVQVPPGANRTADARSELLLRMAHPISSRSPSVVAQSTTCGGSVMPFRRICCVHRCHLLPILATPPVMSSASVG